MAISTEEILETIRMVQMEHLDIRTVTMGINLRDCSRPSIAATARKVKNKIIKYARDLVRVADGIESEYGIPVVNKRISVTPISEVVAPCKERDYPAVARALDEAAQRLGVDFIGGYSALVHKGMRPSEETLINSLPSVLSRTERVCASVNVASTRSGINMDAVMLMGRIIKEAALATRKRSGMACCKLVVFANAPEDNPFMAGAFHGGGEPECVINVGVSGPGVVVSALSKLDPKADLGTVAETVKKTAFKITRMGELVGREVAGRLGVEFGIVDLSLAPSPAAGDSVAQIIERMGISKCGAPGTTAALALLIDAVKKGGAMASSYVGGLSGGFVPVSEDQGMADAVAAGSLSLSKLEAMTSVCSVGLDMIAVPGDTPAETLSAVIADEMAIGVINRKTTGVRIIPVPGGSAGDVVRFGGLFGSAPIMEVGDFSSEGFIKRKGRIPAPISSLTN